MPGRIQTSFFILTLAPWGGRDTPIPFWCGMRLREMFRVTGLAEQSQPGLTSQSLLCEWPSGAFHPSLVQDFLFPYPPGDPAHCHSLCATEAASIILRSSADSKKGTYEKAKGHCARSEGRLKNQAWNLLEPDRSGVGLFQWQELLWPGLCC